MPHAKGYEIYRPTAKLQPSQSWETFKYSSICLRLSIFVPCSTDIVSHHIMLESHCSAK